MTHRHAMPSDLEALVALHALDALEDDERAIVDAAVATNAEHARTLDGYREVAAVLAAAVETTPPTPSPEVWRSISAAIQGRDALAPKLASVVEMQRRRRRSHMATIVSVAAVTVAIGLAARLVSLQRSATGDLERLAAEKVLESGSEVVTLAPADGHRGEGARIVLGADGVGYVVSDTLPALPGDRTYQLWAVLADPESPRVVSVGVLGSDPGVSPFRVVGDVIGFAVTDEVAGGVPVSQGETVAVWLSG